MIKKKQLSITLLSLTMLSSIALTDSNSISAYTHHVNQSASEIIKKQEILDVTLSSRGNLNNDITDALESVDPTSVTTLTVHSSIAFSSNDWNTLVNLQTYLPNIQALNLDTIESRLPSLIFADNDWLTSFKDLSGSILTVSGGDFMSMTSLSTISLPGVITVEDNAFLKATSLQNVDLPSATTIGNHAFSGTSSLKELTLPEAISLGDSIFDSRFSGGIVAGLEKINLPKLQKLGNSVFSGAKNFSSFSAPNITSIGDYCFSGTALKSIVFPTELETVSAGAFWDSSLKVILYSTHNGGINLGNSSYAVPSNIATIGYTYILGKSGTIGQPLTLNLEDNLLINHLNTSDIVLSSTWIKDDMPELSENNLTHFIPNFQKTDSGKYTPNLVISDSTGTVLEKFPLNTFTVSVKA